MAAALIGSCTLPKAAVDDAAASKYTVENVCVLYAEALCAASVQCCTTSGVGHKPELCRKARYDLCQLGAADHLAGRAEFHPERVDACIAQAKAFFDACATFTVDDYFKDNECDWVPFQGRLAEGATCEYTYQCAPPAKGGDPRTLVGCVDRRCTHFRYSGNAGAACTAGPGADKFCDVGLHCDLPDLTADPPVPGTCEPAIPLDQPCDPTEFRCGLGNYCDALSGRCEKAKPLNAPCSSGAECESFECVANKCTSIVVSQSSCFNCDTADVTNAPSAACDPIGQNCGPGAVCTVISGGTVGCEERSGAGMLYSLCSSDAECGPGLNCGNGRCTRPCCPALQGSLCGPQGQCNLITSHPSGVTLRHCNFQPPCEPWSSGAGCTAPETQCNRGGSSTICAAPGAVVALGQPCQFANNCADSQSCAGATGSQVCRWMCKYSNVGAPASGTVHSEPDAQPGLGGCPVGETCVRQPDSTWLGVCEPST